ncbi:hypothetical protein HPB47_000758 [Ixodes persulcatus]|uniref:Uncharacterized protein n=1 Tax=Ixodes persulcatus TaxID=34615 RepID=A0AC60PS65_IXOPE|nr:hypothetical protein HPB47_000758 [Ixodes persulcatus]
MNASWEPVNRLQASRETVAAWKHGGVDHRVRVNLPFSAVVSRTTTDAYEVRPTVEVVLCVSSINAFVNKAYETSRLLPEGKSALEVGHMFSFSIKKDVMPREDSCVCFMKTFQTWTIGTPVRIDVAHCKFINLEKVRIRQLVRGELPNKRHRECTANNDAIESLKQDIVVHWQEFLLVPVVPPFLNHDDRFAYRIDGKAAQPQQLMTDGRKSKEQGK